MFFFNIDSTSGNFQMALDEQLQNPIAFITRMGLYIWKRLPMGLASAPGAIPNLMELLQSELSSEIALVYLDDTIIFDRSFEEDECDIDDSIWHLAKETGSGESLNIKTSTRDYHSEEAVGLLYIHQWAEKQVEIDKISFCTEEVPVEITNIGS